MSSLTRGGDREPWSLPLFPLRTVLFPGGLLPLKVFEQRYIEMTKACMRDERPFGVCMITRGDEVARGDGAIPQFADVGTLARITNFDVPQLGILHLQTEGITRFQVRAHAVDASGLVIGEVTTIADEPQHPLPDAHAPLARILEVIAARLGPQQFPAGIALRQRVLGGLPARRAAAAAAVDQAADARSERRQCPASRIEAVPGAAGPRLT